MIIDMMHNYLREIPELIHLLRSEKAYTTESTQLRTVMQSSAKLAHLCEELPIGIHYFSWRLSKA